MSAYRSLLIKPIVIKNKSHITITGPGLNTLLKLQANSNEPVILIINCHHVTIRDLLLDGNKDQQPSENSARWGNQIRNNAIGIYNSHHILVENCVVGNARSGGIVPALCQNVVIKGCSSILNYYDGIAPFNCHGVWINQSRTRRNGYSGISIDGDCQNVLVDQTRSHRNYQWGLWMGPKQPLDQIHIRQSYFAHNGYGKVAQGDHPISPD